jgi:methionyl aminopeptidase
MIILKSRDEIERMRAAGRVVAEALKIVRESIVPGVTTTMDIDDVVEDVLKRHGAVPSFKGYKGYPRATCTAVNNIVVHGIPGSRVLQEGDIVGVDAGAILDGWQGDCALTLPVGTISAEAQALMDVTREGLMQGIRAARVGNRLSDIGHAIQDYVEKRGYSVVRDLVGHGIGQRMHEDPQVPNYGKPGRGPRLEEGMTLAIEPMVNIGSHQVDVLDDRWTIITLDRSLSAHFEHTVAITRNGPDILTLRPGEKLSL